MIISASRRTDIPAFYAEDIDVIVFRPKIPNIEGLYDDQGCWLCISRSTEATTEPDTEAKHGSHHG